MVDSHSHFDAPEFDPDRAAAHARAWAVGVELQVVPAVDAAGWPKLKAVCAQFPGLHAAYGLHPMYLAEHRPEHLHDLRGWIEREQPVAVGVRTLLVALEVGERVVQQRTAGLRGRQHPLQVAGRVQVLGDALVAGRVIEVAAHQVIDVRVGLERRPEVAGDDVGVSRPAAAGRVADARRPV